MRRHAAMKLPKAMARISVTVEDFAEPEISFL